MAVLRNPRTGATAHLPEKLVARYLKGGWVPIDPTPAPSYPSIEDGWSITNTLDWVGDDPSRARIALTHELSRGTPRVTLVDQLRKLAASPPTPTTGEGEEE